VNRERVLDVERIVRSNDEWRLRRTVNLIASENILSARARALLPSDFGHRYAEGHPGKRYYQGTGNIDVIEARTREALTELFGYRHAEVRTISGTNANDVVFSAFIRPKDPVVVNPLEAGGHISHHHMGGMGNRTKRILGWPRSASNGYLIDVPRAKDLLRRERPSFALLGKSLILFPEPVREIAEVCKELKILLAYDAAHVLGLIAGKQFQDPLRDGCDILMGSTHKTYFGPQRGIIMSNLDEEGWKKIDRKAFPGSLSNHHLFTLPPLLVATYEMQAFGKEYAAQVTANAKHLARSLARQGFDVQCPELDYTESHQVAVDVRKQGGGDACAPLLEQNDIICNYNLLPFDDPKNPKKPSGLRLGVQEMTRVGMKQAEMEELARLFRECLLDRKPVKEEVNRLRERFLRAMYSFDGPSGAAPSDGKVQPSVEVDLAGY
jgi:glycine hydroxymethyltransferase